LRSNAALRAYFKTPIRVFEADEHGAGMKETNIEYLQLTLTPHFSHQVLKCALHVDATMARIMY
jgi:hypothetical protein